MYCWLLLQIYPCYLCSRVTHKVENAGAVFPVPRSHRTQTFLSLGCIICVVLLGFYGMQHPLLRLFVVLLWLICRLGKTSLCSPLLCYTKNNRPAPAAGSCGPRGQVPVAPSVYYGLFVWHCGRLHENPSTAGVWGITWKGLRKTPWLTANGCVWDLNMCDVYLD